MTGAMYSAIAGLKAHMNKLSVIGNNIANINTPAYKKAQTLFSEAIYTTLSAGSNGTTKVGGVNPSQVGYGVSIGSISMDMSTANFNADGDSMHCMIMGDGFFLTGQKPGVTASNTLTETDAQNLELSRVGDFKFDSQGYLVDGRGNVIYGWVTTSGNETAGAIVDADNPKTSGQLVPIRLPMAASQTYPGGTVTAGTAIYPGIETTGGMNVYPAATEELSPASIDSIAIDKATGKITGNMKDGGAPVVVGYIALANVANPSGVTRIDNGYYKAGEGSGKCTAVSIGGAVTAKVNNSTDPDAKSIQSAGTTTLQDGGLESSGTDLATEIAEMITTQRGYQANTRIITVTDSMLEELVNMKR
ncbi:flagellar hook-basal body complex protein [Oscillibacter sp.]|uniref:flagellar hook-basal body protein n=1 Tax=Oscillibacter sp. TaxID=1945593 RepID=UPI00289A2F64|nr:flagellar hook-basal body complex protein [Oscillibacter sp.]